MSVWISSKTNARRHGVYAIARTPPKMIQAIGTGVVAMVGQFPWGPPNQLVTPLGTKELIDMFAPAGMDHLSTGYLSLIGKGFPSLRIVRVLGSGALPAKCVIRDKTTNQPLITLKAKYPGEAGNNLICTIGPVSATSTDKAELVISVTGASGTTSDVFRINQKTTLPTPAEVQSWLATALLLGDFELSPSFDPETADMGPGSFLFEGGTDGNLTAADYVGTPGTGDRGLALLENDRSIRQVFVDDCGDSFRSAVNAGIRLHVELMGDRIGFINGDAGMELGGVFEGGPGGKQLVGVLGDVERFRSERIVYVDPWCFIYDDVTGAEQLVPPAGFAAAVAAQLSPSTSLAWKDSEVGAMLSGIVRLHSNRGLGIADMTDSGIMALIREDEGGHRFEAGVLTIAPSDPSKRSITRTRMGDYIAISFAKSARSMVDAPNVQANQVVLVGMLQAFMDGLLAARESDPAHQPFVDAYEITDLSAVNTQQELAEGNFTIPLNVRIGSSMERIFLSIMHGETVTVRTE